MSTTTLVYKYTLGSRRWELDWFDITLDQSIQLEEVTGVPWPRLCALHDERSAKAVKAFFWLARRLAGEDIAWDSPEWQQVNWREFQMVTDVGGPAAGQDQAAEATPDPTEPAAEPSRKSVPSRKNSGSTSPGS